MKEEQMKVPDKLPTAPYQFDTRNSEGGILMPLNKIETNQFRLVSDEGVRVWKEIDDC